MNTWNTIPLAEAEKLQRALRRLEALTHDDTRAVVDFLLQSGEATFVDLQVGTGLSDPLLEEKLLFLERLKLLRMNLPYYSLDLKRLRRLQSGAATLAKRPHRRNLQKPRN